MYVLPSEGVDERLDLDGRIANAVSAMRLWLRTQTGGRVLEILHTMGLRRELRRTPHASGPHVGRSSRPHVRG
jgi:hypothetical protein